MPGDIDPVVKRAISRCLEIDPSDRPLSAHAVASSLPGGDPLAAALAAGETPSPEMVAAAGGKGILKPRLAMIFLSIIIFEMAALIPLRGASSPAREIEYQPDTYAADAHQILEDLNITTGERAPIERYGFAQLNYPVSAYRTKTILEFWYRESDTILIPRHFSGNVVVLKSSNFVSPENPSPLTDGRLLLKLNVQRQLRELFVRPGAEASIADTPPDQELQELHRLLFTRAGLDFDAFHVVQENSWIPPAHANHEEIFTYHPQQSSSDPTIDRIEIASAGGQLLYFRAVDARPTVTRPDKTRKWSTLDLKANLILLLGVIIKCIAMFLAWRNWLSGRCDMRSAWRVACIAFVLVLIKLRLELGPTLAWLPETVQLAAGTAFLIWIYYLSIEPLARRFWPTILTDWARAISGRWTDPSIGKGILIGAICGLMITLLMEILKTPYVTPYAPQALSGFRYQLAATITILGTPMFYGPFIAAFLVIFRHLLKIDWLAIVLTMGMMIFLYHDETIFTPSTFTILVLIYYGCITNLLIRLGVAAPFSLMFCHHFTERLFITNDWVGPDVSTTVFVFVVVILLVGFGFYSSVGGRPFFSRFLRELA